jgi:hypothetical protein
MSWTTEPGILLMASLLRDGSFDVAEIVLLAMPSSSIWLGPPKVALAGDRFANAANRDSSQVVPQLDLFRGSCQCK